MNNNKLILDEVGPFPSLGSVDLGRDITHDLEEPLYPGIGSSVIELPLTYLGYDSTGLTVEKFIALSAKSRVGNVL